MAELSDRNAIKGVIPALTSQGIKPQVLLNCAGIQRRHPSEKFPDEDWDEVSSIISMRITGNQDNAAKGGMIDAGDPSKPQLRLHSLP